MRQFVENLIAVVVLVGTEAWFLQGYFAGKPEFEPAIALIVALGVLLGKEPLRSALSRPPQTTQHDENLLAEFLVALPDEPTIRLLKG